MAERKLVAALPMLEEKWVDRLRAAAEAHGFTFLYSGAEQDVLPELAEAEVILGQSPLLTRNAPKLKWICTPSAGINQFTAPDAFASPDAVLTNSSGAYGVTIAEHTVMVTLEMLRRMPEYHEKVQKREWIRGLAIRSIRGARVTLLGTGDIGRETAIRLRAFAPACLTGVNRGGRNPEGLFDEIAATARLKEVLRRTDILDISLPGTAETYHLLDAEALAALPDGALIVNVGRGTVIDQKALEAELRSGRLRAALDVFEEEPLRAEDSLWDCPNLLITPHIAGNMTLPYTRQRIVEMFLEDLENYCAGRPLRHRADLKKGY